MGNYRSMYNWTNKYYMRYKVFGLLALAFTPLTSFAQSKGILQNGCPDGFLGTITGTDAIDLDSTNIALGLYNVECTLLGIIKFFVDIAGGVALFMFVYGGMQYYFELRHPGSKAYGVGNKTFYRAAMGLILMAMAHVIMSLIMSGFTRFTSF